jgi:hypothetical protein
VRAGQRYHPALGAVELQIQVPAKIPQVLVQAHCMLIQTGENQPPVRADLGRPQQWPLLALEIPVIGLAEVRHSGQLPFKIVGPSMVRTSKKLRIALFHPAHQHPPMAARVKEHANLPIWAAAHYHRLLSHKAGNEVARVRKLAFVSDVQPTSRKNPFLLQTMDLGIGKNLRADRLALQVYQFFWIDHRIRPAPQFFCATTPPRSDPPLAARLERAKILISRLRLNCLAHPPERPKTATTMTETAGPGTKT